ncbi:hypothetical protein [Herbaspirillum sp. VT-16-41]|nr:hypothetical protein [Herbaspirillum sp. VT-16-41]
MTASGLAVAIPVTFGCNALARLIPNWRPDGGVPNQ